MPMALLPLAPVVDGAPAGTPDYVREWKATARVPAEEVTS